MREYIEEFRVAMESAGLTPPPDIEPDGDIHRFATNGKRGDKAGWYVLHVNGGIPFGAFGDWRTEDVKGTWHADIGRKLSSKEKATLRLRDQAMRREWAAVQAQQRADARAKARAIWQRARPAPDDHVYLLHRGVRAHGLRVYKGNLVVPILIGDVLHSLQFITGDGSKKFLTGGRVEGCYYLIGKPNGVVCIVEGYATGASVHEATGHAVAVAFHAGNLTSVARSLRQASPDLRLILCADDDAKSETNPGMTKAHEAARTVEGFLAVPNFGARRPENATDFNDLHRQAGLDAVRVCIDGARRAESSELLPAVIYRRMSEVQAQPIRWLWPGRFARGKLSMIAGNPGLGKSQITASLAGIVTTGAEWPLNEGRCEVGSVIFLSAEDDAADTIKPRLLAAGADTTRCLIVDAVSCRGPDGASSSRGFNLQTDLNRLSTLMSEIGDVALVVIDPISAYLGGTDSHKNAEVRTVLAPLAGFAARHGVAVVLVSHLNKASGSEALMRVTGSLGFVAAARAAYVVVREKDEPLRRLFLPIKNNIGNDQAGLAFSVQSHTVDSSIETSRIVWENGPVTLTADEAMQPVQLDDERSQSDDIADLLHDLLYEGRMKSQEVLSKAKQAGFAGRSVQRTAKAIGVTIKREGHGRETATYWSLPSLAPT